MKKICKFCYNELKSKDICQCKKSKKSNLFTRADLVVFDAFSQLKMILKKNWNRIKDYKSNYFFVTYFVY